MLDSLGGKGGVGNGARGTFFDGTNPFLGEGRRASENDETNPICDLEALGTRGLERRNELQAGLLGGVLADGKARGAGG